MAVTGFRAADLVRLLNQAAGAVYVLDEQRRIVFANRACAAWVGCSADDLVGQECRYHSSPEATGVAALAAALAPPPDVWMAQRATAAVSFPREGSTPDVRQVTFLPLSSDAIDLAGVVAVAAPGATEDLAQPSPPADDDSAAALHARLRQWRKQLAGRYHLDRLLGNSPAMVLARRQIEFAAESAASVAIVGPPGSGRRHAARAIHYGRSPQAAAALVPLACPLLDIGLVESTLRDLKPDGVPSAADRAAGRRLATLLLEDVDQLDGEVQQPLVHSLHSAAGVRVISTTRESLSVRVARGEFRLDLACALATVEIRLPPLVERLADLPMLVQMLVEDHNRQGAKQVTGLTAEGLDRLAAYAWPGNLDELARVITAAHQQAAGAWITAADLPLEIQVAVEASARPRRQESPIDLEKFLAQIEEELIRRALARAKGNKAKAARLLGMTRPRLYRRLVQLGLEEPPPESPSPSGRGPG